ncbi:MAG: restriction endonuclease subunit S [Eubacterium sp.]|nr:restriction endonuclease subunit S [Eubacterium sp.]
MEKVRLGDVCKIISGSTPKTNIEEYWNGDIIGYETQLLLDSLMQKFFESSFWRILSIERIYSRIL